MDHCICDQPECWRPVPGYEGLYEVSDHGRVLSVRANRLLKPRPDDKGRPYVRLYRDGRVCRRYVHRLVLTAFDKPRPDGLEGCHWDDIKTHNCLGNLRWDTRSANQYDRVRNGGHHNTAKTHCPKNHEYTEANTRVSPDGGRVCRACDRDRGSSAERKARKNAG